MGGSITLSLETSVPTDTKYAPQKNSAEHIRMIAVIFIINDLSFMPHPFPYPKSRRLPFGAARASILHPMKPSDRSCIQLKRIPKRISFSQFQSFRAYLGETYCS